MSPPRAITTFFFPSISNKEKNPNAIDFFLLSLSYIEHIGNSTPNVANVMRLL